MHHAGVSEYSDLGRPNMAHLIQRRGNASDSTVAYGFNVFQVKRDQETTLSEPTMKYRPGGQEDTVISIAPEVMGLAGDEGKTFKIGMLDRKSGHLVLSLFRRLD